MKTEVFRIPVRTKVINVTHHWKRYAFAGEERSGSGAGEMSGDTALSDGMTMSVNNALSTSRCQMTSAMSDDTGVVKYQRCLSHL